LSVSKKDQGILSGQEQKGKCGSAVVKREVWVYRRSTDELSGRSGEFEMGERRTHIRPNKTGY
jgi:hypothetical protein